MFPFDDSPRRNGPPDPQAARSRRSGLPVLAIAFVLPLSVSAHDLWLEKSAGGYTLYQGHRHSTHEGAEIVPYDPGAIRQAICLGSAGTAQSPATTRNYPVRITGDCSALLIDYSTGYWTKTAWQTLNQPRTAVAGAMKSWLSEESIKRVERWTPAAARPLGPGLEITPTTDPFAVAIGDKLTVRVTQDRKPRTGVAVAYQGDTRGVTGDDGLIALRIRRGGTQLISASMEAPLDDGKADVVVRGATLQFDLAK